MVPLLDYFLVCRVDSRGVAIMADYPTTLGIVFSLAFIIGRFSGALSRVFYYVVRKRKEDVML
jgi:hypothetical protein